VQILRWYNLARQTNPLIKFIGVQIDSFIGRWQPPLPCLNAHAAKTASASAPATGPNPKVGRIQDVAHGPAGVEGDTTFLFFHIYDQRRQ
jgi:hypothetical protein